mmetsp:Transcript_94624/g.294770  ORF Transcript_94624/g.294770 Transcript_94624/m.294770 type:complete len:252 (+) Transcript_94624:623-1378(+)
MPLPGAAPRARRSTRRTSARSPGPSAPAGPWPPSGRSSCRRPEPGASRRNPGSAGAGPSRRSWRCGGTLQQGWSKAPGVPSSYQVATPPPRPRRWAPTSPWTACVAWAASCRRDCEKQGSASARSRPPRPTGGTGTCLRYYFVQGSPLEVSCPWWHWTSQHLGPPGLAPRAWTGCLSASTAWPRTRRGRRSTSWPAPRRRPAARRRPWSCVGSRWARPPSSWRRQGWRAVGLRRRPSRPSWSSARGSRPRC